MKDLPSLLIYYCYFYLSTFIVFLFFINLYRCFVINIINFNLNLFNILFLLLYLNNISPERVL